eukprot:3386284-Rhodomonas_salina.2
MGRMSQRNTVHQYGRGIGRALDAREQVPGPGSGSAGSPRRAALRAARTPATRRISTEDGVAHTEGRYAVSVPDMAEHACGR